MSPMGIRLSPVGVAVFCLLGLGLLYHLYAGVISSRLAAFRQRNTVDLRDLLALSVEAAVQGGLEVKRVRENNVLEEKTKGKTKEGANEKLTLGDLNSHKKMYYLIKNTYPEITVNSEEHDSSVDEALVWSRDLPDDILQAVRPGHMVPADSITVWIDPLDATQEYTENLVKYVTTMVCVAVDGKPLIGVIHKPFTGFTAWGLVGQGSNLKPRSSYSSSPPRVIVSRSHSGDVRAFVENSFGNNTVIIPAGGAGYKVLSLLDSREEEMDLADVYLHTTFIKKWDICAGDALLSSMGGHMTTLKGEQIQYTGGEGNPGGLLASVGVDHQALLGRLAPLKSGQH